NITNSLIAQGAPAPVAAKTAASAAQLQGGSGGGSVSAIPLFIRADFASATQSVLYGMGVVMAVAAVVAILGLRRGVQQPDAETGTASAAASATSGFPE